MLSLAQVVRRLLSLFPLIAMLTLLCVACSPWAQAQSADRVLGTINPNARTTVPGHPPSWASSQNDTGAMPADITLDHLTLILARSPEMQQAFEQFLASQQDPGSADYHQWLTPIEVGERFGVSLHDIAAVSDWLRSQGLHVDSTSSSRDRITFSGSASAVGNAFGAEMHYFKVNGKQHISITSEPRIPAALAPVIKAIHGLYTIEHHPAHKSTVGYFSGDGAAPALNGSGGSHFIAPADFATIYDLNSVYNGGIKGTGQTIAIVGEARVYNPDIENFQSLSGLATKDPTVTVPPNGVDPGPPASSGNAPGVQGEATLDVARSGSIAPDATILLVVSALAGGGIDTATEYVVDTTPVPAHIMSISFIGCEANGGPGRRCLLGRLVQSRCGGRYFDLCRLGRCRRGRMRSLLSNPSRLTSAHSKLHLLIELRHLCGRNRVRRYGQSQPVLEFHSGCWSGIGAQLHSRGRMERAHERQAPPKPPLRVVE